MQVKTKRNIKAFSIIEAIFASVLVSLGIAAVVGASLSHTRVNREAQSLNTAVMLAQQIREYTTNRSFFNVTSQTFDPCIDAMGDPISGCDGWTQQISIGYRNTNDITAQSATPTSVKFVTVSIIYNGNTVLSDSWLKTYRWEE